MKKIILITGASSGFGKLTAQKLLDSKKWIVYASARRIEKMEDLKSKGANILKIDVTSTEDVNSGIQKIIEKHGKIDAVFANAGYGSYGMIESVPMEEIKYQYDVNVFGVARVLKAVLPYMREHRSGRIVITASLVSHLSLLASGWYASTKHAVNAVATALRQEVKDLGIKVVLIEPGVVKTGFDSIAINSLKKVQHPEDYKILAEGYGQFLKDLYDNCPGPKGTVKQIVKALTCDKPKKVYRTTFDAKMFPIIKTILSKNFIDNVLIFLTKRAFKKIKRN